MTGVLHSITMYYVLTEERGKNIEKLISLRIDDRNQKAIEEIANIWGNVTSQSDVIRYCIYYTWKHAVKNQHKDSSSK